MNRRNSLYTNDLGRAGQAAVRNSLCGNNLELFGLFAK